MSDDSDNSDNDDNSINFDDFDDEIDLYDIKENKIEILEKNQIFNEDVYSKEIEKIHNKIRIYNPDLLNLIDNCVDKNILNYTLIEQIAHFANNNSKEGEVINNLIELYSFLLELDFNEDECKYVREIIKNNLNEQNLNNKINFKENVNKIKEEIIIKKLNIEYDYIKNLIKSCVEKKWSFKIIKIFHDFLKPLYIKSLEGLEKEKLELIKVENEHKIHVSKSLLEIIDAFPDSDLQNKMKNIKFDNLSKVARDFYINCAHGKSVKKQLDIQELLNALQKSNKNYFNDDKLNLFKKQIDICKEKFRKMNPKYIKKWKNEEFVNYFKDEQYKNKDIAETLGVIFSGFKKKIKDFKLREAQILAILIFIDNFESQNSLPIKDQKGIIEEISTGEGKSAIICCLAAYFGLLRHKVDIITSSSILAERDASDFKNFYDLFILKCDSCKDKKHEPYKADILYGTFLSFEGDYLEYISNNNKTRGDRPYDIIIIDEVDNAFIDCIEGSTQLTQSSKGYQFLIPMYISIYFFVDILDNIYLQEIKEQYEEIISKEEYKNLSEESKNKLLTKLSDDSDRKDVFIKYIENLFRNILKQIDEEEKQERNKENEGQKKKAKTIQELDDNSKLKNFFRYPYFLKDFVENNLHSWINNAFAAKNEMQLEKDYTLSSKRNGYKTITPIDRKNTGELEFDTIYKKGLHQMLEIKEKVRVSSETLDCTFMSHVYYFSLFKERRKFFGLTGTIGGEETNRIYKSKYFDSNLVFIPSYMAKRFVELPAIICQEDYEKHLIEICKEIIFEFIKGRKILVICKDIKEGNDISTMLKEKDFIIDNYNFKIDEEYKQSILLYLRNDDENFENKLNTTNKRIIISTNLGGRGTNIKTSDKVEENGGLHVILTKLSKNSRTQKQAFGRTSRKGNKGSGQYICTEKKGLKTYNELIKDRDEKERNFINSIDLDYLDFKDKLFQKYTHFIREELKQRGEDNYLKIDIDEKWAYFLDTNIEKKLDENEINKSFDSFKQQINELMKLSCENRFKNNFLKIYYGINEYENFEEGLEAYLNFENNSQCFYFASSYYKARIEYEKHKLQFDKNIKNDFYCKNIVNYLKETKDKLNKLIEINIEPVLKSFIDWEKISKLDKLLQGIKDNYSDKSFFFTQFENRKLLIKKLIEIIEQNINIVQEYIDKYLPKNKKGEEIVLDVLNIEIEKSLNLGDEYKLDINEYIKDAGLTYTFKFIIKKKVLRRNFIYWIKFIGFFIFLGILTVMNPLIIIGAYHYIFKTVKDYLAQSKKEDYIDVHEYNSLYSIIESLVYSIFQEGYEQKNIIQKNANNNIIRKIEHNEPKEERLNLEELVEFQEKINEEINNNIEESFSENKGIIFEEVKFLLFIDLLYQESKWKEIIRKIIIDYFNEDKRFEQKSELIKLCAKKSGHKNALEKLKSAIKESVINIINKIKEKFDSKEEYNENEIKRLEHIIIKQLYGDINENSASKIVEQIFEQNIIDNNGMFNKDLFEKEKEKDRKEHKKKEKNELINKEKIQNVKLYYNTPFPNKINKIKNINNFSLKLDFDLNLNNDKLIQDVQILYFNKNYKNPNELLKKDISSSIIDLLSQMYDLSLTDINEEVDKLFEEIKQKISVIILTYLKEEIYPNILVTSNKKINIQLNKEEQEVYKLISENSGKKAIELLKSKDLFK